MERVTRHPTDRTPTCLTPEDPAGPLIVRTNYWKCSGRRVLNLCSSCRELSGGASQVLLLGRKSSGDACMRDRHKQGHL